MWASCQIDSGTLLFILANRIFIQAHMFMGCSCTNWRYLLVRERNLLALPTLDMYLPLSKFEYIH